MGCQVVVELGWGGIGRIFRMVVVCVGGVGFADCVMSDLVGGFVCDGEVWSVLVLACDGIGESAGWRVIMSTSEFGRVAILDSALRDCDAAPVRKRVDEDRCELTPWFVASLVNR